MNTFLDTVLPYAVYAVGWLVLAVAYLCLAVRLFRRRANWLSYLGYLWLFAMGGSLAYLLAFSYTNTMAVNWCANALTFFGPLGAIGFPIIYLVRKLKRKT